MKKVLFLPSDHGGGRGHVTRSFYLADKLNQMGCQTAVVLDKHFNKEEDPPVPVVRFKLSWERVRKIGMTRPVRHAVRLKSKLTQPPVFHEFTNLSYQVPRDGYLNERIVKYRLKQLDRIIDRFKPDVLIGDTHFLTYLSGKRHSIPVVQITRLAGFPERPKLLWWMEKLPLMKEPEATHPFRKAAESAGLEEPKRAEDLLKGDRYLVPAIHKIEPIRRTSDSIHFVGPLNRIYYTPKRIAYFEEKNEYPKIYITIGGGAGRFREEQFFNTIIDIFNKSEYKVLVTTGGKLPAKQFNGRAANIYFVDWVDGVSAIHYSDLVIHHGGYSTMIETLLAGKPALVLPSHSEQEGNGRRLAKLEVGDILPIYDDPLTPVEFTWPYGTYTMNAAFHFQIDGELLKQKIHRLLYGGTYQRLKKISARLKQQQEETDLIQLISF